jgi:uncharacterized protein
MRKMTLHECSKITLCVLLAVTASIASGATPPAPAVKDAVQDVFVPGEYKEGFFEGYLGKRLDINLEKRLLAIDLESILKPYRNRGTAQEWAGEYVGKYLHAACLTWEVSGNPALKTKMDYMAAELMKTQLPDGYLGTYLPDHYWTAWDVWAHKYSMLGLLEYYHATGNAAALEASKKAANLLLATFNKDGRDIIASGTHVGMAPTSVLEPMVMLYRYTGEAKYLDFCQYLVSTWDQKNGPGILTALLAGKGVNQIGNAKSYEMLSCIVGLAELYRITGKADYFTACKNAWQDIKTKRAYVIGSASYEEHFHGDLSLRIDSPHAEEGPAEGCVSVTWLQLSWHLLRLTGEAKYGDELERIAFNSIPAAQSPQDGKICYHLALDRNEKDYGKVNHGIQPDISCCAFSIPRGLALIPQLVTGSLSGDLAVNLFLPGSYSVRLPENGLKVNYNIKTTYPETGDITLQINPAESKQFKLRLRVPNWSTSFKATAKGKDYSAAAGEWLVIDDTWTAGDLVQVSIDLPLRIEKNPDPGSPKVSISRGPQVLALDDSVTSAAELPATWIGKQVYEINTNTGKKIMVPYADAGQLGKACEIYLAPCVLTK